MSFTNAALTAQPDFGAEANPAGKTMVRLAFTLINVKALCATVSALWHAPEGYEDETGFHYRRVAG
jgi:hypothetical protein